MMLESGLTYDLLSFEVTWSQAIGFRIPWSWKGTLILNMSH